ncbi:DUF6037 family protein [Saccharibacillus sacchari]|uniref:DUF6037 family protein n=1 Tax=Saccharibacillus sacchari TaxID=456493 RepID=A0ACC6PCL6_9BACL
MNSSLFGNLEQLKKDMKKKKCPVDSFLFGYNKQQYVVLVKPYAKGEKKPPEALMQLEFLRVGKLRDRLAVPATKWQFMLDARAMRNYFDIEYTENLGEVFRDLYERFADFIPIQVLEDKSEIEQQVLRG